MFFNFMTLSEFHWTCSLGHSMSIYQILVKSHMIIDSKRKLIAVCIIVLQILLKLTSETFIVDFKFWEYIFEFPLIRHDLVELFFNHRFIEAIGKEISEWQHYKDMVWFLIFVQIQLNFIKYNDLHMNCAKQTLSKPYIKVVLILSCVDLDYTEFMIDSTQKCKLMTILLI